MRNTRRNYIRNSALLTVAFTTGKLLTINQGISRYGNLKPNNEDNKVTTNGINYIFYKNRGSLYSQ